jgi:outer membrane protein TolC
VEKCGIPVLVTSFYILLFAGCVHDVPRVYGLSGTSVGPQASWVPPTQVLKKQEKFQDDQAEKNAQALPREYLDNINSLGLSDIVNIALQNNKLTRQTWAQARAAAASYASKVGSYFPVINGSAAGSNQKNPTLGAPYAKGVWSYTAGASLSWLIFNFGGRSASVEETREALFAADWSHNAEIQSVILQVEQAYYGYFTAKSLLAAQQAAVDEAKTNQTATDDRHSAGLATIADVLQARTALSQAQLGLAVLSGQVMTTRGFLATAMGVGANTAFDVVLPVSAPPQEMRRQTVQECLDSAIRKRPDLAAAQTLALEADAHARSVRAEAFPQLSANGSYGWLSLVNLNSGYNLYSAGLGLTIPIFAGFSHHYDAVAARAQADAAYASAQNVKDLVTLQVWTSYYGLQTADQTVVASDDLLASATENHDVALGRYTSGVGSIIDLLTAQAALESARALQIQARAGWWLSAAQLAHDMGTLEITPSTAQGSK